MPDGGDNQTTIQKSDPWEGAVPYLKYGMQEAQNLYQSNLPSYYPGSTVAAQSPETLAGIQALASRGMMGSPLVQGAQAQQAGTIGGQFLNSNPGNPTFQAAASGGMVNPALGMTQDMAQNYQANPALGMLQQTAQGDFIGQNPYLDAQFDRAAGKMRSNVDSLFSSAGRYGSNAHQGTLQEGLGDLATSLYGGAYNQERANQLAAQQALGGFANQDFANRLGAIGQLGGLAQQGFANQFAGAQGLAGTYGQERGFQEAASGNAPGLAQSDYQDIAAVQQAGALRDQYGQQLLNADIARHDFAQNIPAQKLAQYMALVNGGTVGGTVTSQVPSQNNMLGQLGGLGLGLAGLGLGMGWF